MRFAGPPIHAAHPSPYQGPPLHYDHSTYPPPGFGFQGVPPGVYGTAPGPPPSFHQLPDHGHYPIPPAPSHSGYIPTPGQHDQDSYRPQQHQSYRDKRQDWSDDRRPCDKWENRRSDKRNHKTLERRDQKDHSREERWHERGRQGNHGSFERRNDRIILGEPLSHNHDRFRSLSRAHSERSSRSDSRRNAQMIPTSSHNSPIPHVSVPLVAVAAPKLAENLHDFNAKDHVGFNQHAHPEKEQPPQAPLEQAGSPEEKGNADEMMTDDEGGDRHPDDEFLEDLKAAFVEFVPKHQGDPIAEPLPEAYTEDIMLPPAFDAKRVKSEHITPSNLDDFALSIRDTNQWNKYRDSPVFLPPGEVNLRNLESYLRSAKKGQGNRNEKRGRTHGHGHGHGKDQSRNQRSNNRDRSDRNSDQLDAFARKRKWNDHDPGPTRYGARHLAKIGHPPQHYELATEVSRQMSPEPGEISDTPVSTIIQHPASRPAHLPPKPDVRPWPELDLSYHRDYYEPHFPKPYAPAYRESNGDFNARNTIEHWKGTEGSPESRGYSPGPPSSHKDVQRPPSPRPGRWDEESVNRQSREPSQKPLLDALQSHINMLCASSTSDDVELRNTGQHCGGIEEPLPSHRGPEVSSRRLSRSSTFESRPVSRTGPGSRRSSLGKLSQSSDIGSPLTRIEAELLGLVGADDDDDEEESSIKQTQDDRKTPVKRKQRKIHSAFE